VNVSEASPVLRMFRHTLANSFLLLRHDLFENQGPAFISLYVRSYVIFAEVEAVADRFLHLIPLPMTAPQNQARSDADSRGSHLS